MATIYGLYDRQGRLRYIGKSDNPSRRLKEHMREQRRRTPLYDWLRKHGQPELRILEANCADWQEAERRLIAQHRLLGSPLLNLADGGDQPKCPREVQVSNGKALNARLRANPLDARIRYLKVSMGRRLARGELNDEQIAKLRYCARKAPHIFGKYRNLPNADGTPYNGD